MTLRSFIDLVEMFNWDEHTLLFELFDMDKFLSRAKGVQALIVRGGTEGEKEAAKGAMERMVARATEEAKELSPQVQQHFWRQFDAIRATTTANAERASARRSSDDFYRGAQPQADPYKRKPDQAEKDAEYARQQERARRNQQRADSEDREWREDKARQRDRENNTGGGRNELGKIFAYAEFREGTSDKVYGIVKWQGDYYTFWGRNGASLSTKMQESHNAANIIFHSKIRKGYEEKPITSYVDRWVMQNLRF